MLAVLLILSVILISVPVMAEQTSAYTITGYTSHISLNPDGSVYFDETITYQIDEGISQIVKPMPMGQSSRIEDMHVFSMLPADTGSSAQPELKELEQVDNLPGNAEDVYSYSLADAENDIYHITIPVTGSKREEKTIVYRYRLMDTVFIYKDTAAFFWQFILPEQGIEARNIVIEAALPEKASSDEVVGYARGAVNTGKEVLEDGTFRLTVEKVKKDEYLESVLLAPVSLFPEGRKLIDNFAEDDIMSDMASWEDKAQQEKRKDELRFYGSMGLSLLSVLLCIGTGLLMYMKTRKRKVKAAKLPEIKGLPDREISPAELGVLLSRGKARSRELLSTILYLIHTRHLELQYRQNNEVIVAVRDDKGREKLKPHEEYVLNWMIKEKANNNGSLTLELISRIIAGYGRDYRKKSSTWEKLVYRLTEKRRFQVKLVKEKVLAMAVVLIALITAAVSGLVLDNHLAGLLTGIFALALAAYVIPLKKISDEAEEYTRQWLQFSEYIQSLLEGKGEKLPIDKWEEYLAYAVPLKMAGEILDKLPYIYKASAFEDGNLTILYKTNHSWLKDILKK